MKKTIALLFLASSLFAGTLAINQGGTGTAVIMQGSTSSGGSGTPGGSNTQFQYNNSGAFGGSSDLTQGTSQINITTLVASSGTVTTALTNQLNAWVPSAGLTPINVFNPYSDTLGTILNASNGSPLSGFGANTFQIQQGLLGDIYFTSVKSPSNGGTYHFRNGLGAEYFTIGTSSITVNSSDLTITGSFGLSLSSMTFRGGTASQMVRTDANKNLVSSASLTTTELVGVLGAAQFPALTGDVTTTAGALGTTLASVITANQFGSASVVPVITFDAKGRLTAVSSATIPVVYSTMTIQLKCTGLDKLETNFAVNTATNTATSNYMTCSFDNTTRQYVNGQFMVPYNLASSGNITIRTSGRSSTAASSKNVSWILEHQPLTNGESNTTAYLTSTSGNLAVSATQGIKDQLSWSMTVSSSTWAANDMVNFRFSRQVGVTNDLASPYYTDLITVELPITTSITP